MSVHDYMIEFTLNNGNPCAVNPRKVTAIWPKADGCYISFDSNDYHDVLVKEPYEDVLAKIRASNKGGS